MEQIATTLQNLKGRLVILSTHRNADPDAIASLYSIYTCLKDLKAYPYIVLPEGLNEISKNIITRLGIGFDYMGPGEASTLCSHTDYVIIVDTSNPSQLGILWSYIKEHRNIIVIDHHRRGGLEEKAYLSLIAPGIPSNSEIVYEILQRIWFLSPLIATILITGIVYDTRRFLYAKTHTFKTVSALIEKYNANYNLAITLLQKKMEQSERIARLKGCQRMSFDRYNDIIIAYTHVSAYESSVARAIIDLGADLVFVFSEKLQGILRIVARCTQEFVKKNSLSLGRDIMPQIAEEFLYNGSGGGHDTAAVAEGIGRLDETIKNVKRYMRKIMGAKTSRHVGSSMKGIMESDQVP